MMTLRQHLHAVQLGRCFYCASNIRICDGTIDHFFPKSKGNGRYSNGRHNVVMACRRCNGTKGDRMPTAAEIVRFDEVHGATPFVQAGQLAKRERQKAWRSRVKESP
jgi:5-methylcytosine-specific restriction endonuclease McrA